MSKNSALSTPVIDFISGSAAGIASTAVSHPLELVKTRLQVDRKITARFGASWQVARDVVLKEGGPRALYRGLIPNLWGNTLGWALYFALYGDLKARIGRIQGRNHTLTFWEYFSASATAGIAVAVFTNPIWVIKTRMLSTARQRQGSYATMVAGFRSIFQLDGIRGFYRGFVPSLYGILHGALQFMVYEKLKAFRSHQEYGKPDQQLSTADYLWTSAVSKVMAGVATYPYQVVRSRLQMHDAEDSYRSARNVVRQIWRQEGPAGLYKGLAPNLFRVLPSTCVTFIVYESTRHKLRTP